MPPPFPRPSAAIWRGFALALVCLAFAAGAGDLTSTNLDRLTRFWHVAESSNRPVRVLSFGDSLAENYRSLQTQLFNRLGARLGSAGLGLPDRYNTLAAAYSGGAAVVGAGSNWWTWHYSVPPGGFVSWTNLAGPQFSVRCDSVGLFWIARPEGGTFTVSVATNGGPWSAPLLTLDGAAATAVGRFTNTPLARARYRLRVDGLSGTNLVLGPQFLDAGVPGVFPSVLAQGGVNLKQVFAVSTNILHPVFAALQPDLVVWHMKELVDIGGAALTNGLAQLQTLLRATCPQADLLYIGTPFEQRDLTNNVTAQQNELVRAVARRDGRACFDGMNPCVSYSGMTNNGYLDDAVHPNNRCYAFLADVLWREAGFFALRVDRRLRERLAAGLVVVEWPTTNGITYTLDASPDLAQWSPLRSMPGDGAWHSYTNPPAGPDARLFRLRLPPAAP